MDRPPEAAVNMARSLLTMLGALDGSGRPTPAGSRMLAIPIHPRLAHMISAAPPGQQSLACLVGALLDERDVFNGRADDLPTDLGLRIEVLTGRAHDERTDRRSVARIVDRARDLARRAGLDFD
ncbi:MAG: ATP-dependent helicase HrpB, partial [Actinomycetota bacterium]